MNGNNGANAAQIAPAKTINAPDNDAVGGIAIPNIVPKLVIADNNPPVIVGIKLILINIANAVSASVNAVTPVRQTIPSIA